MVIGYTSWLAIWWCWWHWWCSSFVSTFWLLFWCFSKFSFCEGLMSFKIISKDSIIISWCDHSHLSITNIDYIETPNFTITVRCHNDIWLCSTISRPWDFNKGTILETKKNLSIEEITWSWCSINSNRPEFCQGSIKLICCESFVISTNKSNFTSSCLVCSETNTMDWAFIVFVCLCDLTISPVNNFTTTASGKDSAFVFWIIWKSNWALWFDFATLSSFSFGHLDLFATIKVAHHHVVFTSSSKSVFAVWVPSKMDNLHVNCNVSNWCEFTSNFKNMNCDFLSSICSSDIFIVSWDTDCGYESCTFWKPFLSNYFTSFSIPKKDKRLLPILTTSNHLPWERNT